MYGLLGVSSLILVIRIQNGIRSWVPRLNVCKLWVRKFGDVVSESSICGMQRNLSSCKPVRPKSSLQGDPCCLKGTKGAQTWVL